MKILFTILIWGVTLLLLSAQEVEDFSGVNSLSGTEDNLDKNLATYNNPHGIDIGPNGNIYIADRYNHSVRKITVTGQVITIAGSGEAGDTDGPAENAQFNEPWGVCVGNNDEVYVADAKNNKIKVIYPNGTVATLAGSGNAGFKDSDNPKASTFFWPSDVDFDHNNGDIYVAGHLSHIIRKIDSTGNVSTIAGSKVGFPGNHGSIDGIGSEAKFYRPYGIHLAKDGSLYVADEWNSMIRKISPEGIVSTIGGQDQRYGYENGSSVNALYNYPWDITTDNSGNLYVLDGYNHVIRKVVLETNDVSLFAGVPLEAGADHGPVLTANFNGATSIAYNENDGSLYIADAYNHMIRRIALVEGITISLEQETTCYGDTVKVIADPGYYDKYYWYEGDSLLGVTSDSEYYFLAKQSTAIYAKGERLGMTTPNSNTIDKSILSVLEDSVLIDWSRGECVGDTVLLTSKHSTVKWSTGQESEQIEVYSDGLYGFEYLEDGCVVSTGELDVQFSLPPTIVVDTHVVSLKANEMVELGVSGAVTYEWSTGSVGDTIMVNEPSLIEVIGISDKGCRSAPEYIRVVEQLDLIPYPDTLLVPYDEEVTINLLNNDFFETDPELIISNVILDDLLLNHEKGILEVHNQGVLFDTIIELKYVLFDRDKDMLSDTVPVFLVLEGVNMGLNLSVEGETVCYGDTIKIVAKPDYYNKYYWYQGDSLLSVTTDAEYEFVGEKDIAIYASGEQKGYTSTNSNTIERALQLVLDVPISQDLSNGECEGDTIILSSQYPSVKWNTGEEGPTLNIHTYGLYEFEYWEEGCLIGKGQTEVTFLKAPIITVNSHIASFKTNEMVELAVSGAATYEWSTGSVGDTVMVGESSLVEVVGMSEEGCRSIPKYIRVVEYLTLVAYADTLVVSFNESATVDLLSNDLFEVEPELTMSFGSVDGLQVNYEKGVLEVKNQGVLFDTIVELEYVLEDKEKGISSDIVPVFLVIDGINTDIKLSTDMETVCIGDTVKIVADPTYYEKYYWYEGDSLLAVTIVGEYNFLANRETEIYATGERQGLTTGNSNTVRNGILSVLNDTISIDSSRGVCIGDTMTLASKYPNVRWSTGEESATIDVSSDGLYDFEYLEEGCLASKGLIEVKFEHPPIIIVDTHIVFFKTNELVELGVSGAPTYEWSTGSVDDKIMVGEPSLIEVVGVSDKGCRSEPKYIRVMELVELVAQPDSLTVPYQEIVTIDLLKNDLFTGVPELSVIYEDENSLLISEENGVLEVYNQDILSDTVIELKYILYDEINELFSDTVLVVLVIESSLQDPFDPPLNDSLGVSSGEPFIPSGFSPNGDGVNDYFEILNMELVPNNSLEVFNRWGQSVYYQDNYDNSWQGGNNNDNALIEGTYFYIFINTDSNQKYSGYVLIKK